MCDLLINLFKDYLSVCDESFCAWLTCNQDIYEEGTSITPDELTHAAAHKFDSMVEKGTWNAPMAKGEIIALETCYNMSFKS
jgi:hypothetical protein